MSFQRLMKYWSSGIESTSTLTSDVVEEESSEQMSELDTTIFNVSNTSVSVNTGITRDSMLYFDASDTPKGALCMDQDSIPSTHTNMDMIDSNECNLPYDLPSDLPYPLASGVASGQASVGAVSMVSTDWNDVASESGSFVVIKGACSESESDTGSFVQLNLNETGSISSSRPQSTRFDSRPESTRVSPITLPMTLTSGHGGSHDSSNEGSFIHTNHSSGDTHDGYVKKGENPYNNIVQSLIMITATLPTNGAQSIEIDKKEDEVDEEAGDDDGSDTGSFVPMHEMKASRYAPIARDQSTNSPDNTHSLVDLETIRGSVIGVENTMGDDTSSELSLTAENLAKTRVQILPMLTQVTEGSVSSDAGSMVHVRPVVVSSLVRPVPNMTENTNHFSSEMLVDLNGSNDSSNEGSCLDVHVKETTQDNYNSSNSNSPLNTQLVSTPQPNATPFEVPLPTQQISPKINEFSPNGSPLHTNTLRPRSKTRSPLQVQSKTFPAYNPPVEEDKVSPSVPPRTSRLNRPNSSQSRSRLFVLQSVLERAKSTSSLTGVDDALVTTSVLEEKKRVRFLGKEVSLVIPCSYDIEEDDYQSLYYSDSDANYFKEEYELEQTYASQVDMTWYEWMHDCKGE